MKHLSVSIIALMVVLFSCQKDTQTPDRTEPDQLAFGKVEGGVKKPMKVEYYSTPDWSKGFVQCMPIEFGDVKLSGGFFIGGSSTHTGEVNMMHSTATNTSCAFGPQPGQLTLNGNGTIMADNGDLMYFTHTMIVNAVDLSFTGTVTMNSGTGKFLDSHGVVEMIGSTDRNTGNAMWTANGYIIMKK